VDTVLGGDFSLKSVEASHRTPSILPNSSGIENTDDSLPGYGQPILNDTVLDHMISDLIPPIVQSTNPIPLPSFLGTLPVLSLIHKGFLAFHRGKEGTLYRPCVVKGSGFRSLSHKN
jgi:hypothetical protein